MTYDPFDPFNALVAETPPEVLAAGQVRTPDLGGRATTREMTAAIVAAL